MTVRKILLVALMILVVSGSVFAGGNKEDNDPTNDGFLGLGSGMSMANMLKDRPGKISGFMDSVAGIFDEITTAFCLAATPFPNTLLQFYSEVANKTDIDTGEEYQYNAVNSISPSEYESLTLANSLLLSDSYYTSNMGAGEDGRATLTYNNFTFSGKTITQQKGIWNMVTILFVSFLTAEIVFTAIFHYVSEKEGSVLKEVLAKAFVSLCIFLVAASLPFLIEAFRLGFSNAALVLTGINDYIALMNDEGSLIGNTSDEVLPGLVSATGEEIKMDVNVIGSLNDMKNLPVFFYPGILIRLLSDTIDFLDPEDIAGTGVSLFDEGDAGLILSGLMHIVYLIVRIVAMVMILVTALHIMYNVCEVYILLGCVMVLLPFTIFSPLKFLGEKAVMSLFANVLELFVIIMVMFISVSFTLTVAQALLLNLVSSVRTIVVDIEIGNPEAWANEYWSDYQIKPEYLTYDEDKKQSIFVYSGVVLSIEEGLSSGLGIYVPTYPQSGEQTTYLPADSGLYLAPFLEDKYNEFLDANKYNPNGKVAELTQITHRAYQAKGMDISKYVDWLQGKGLTALPAQDKLRVIQHLFSDYATDLEATVTVTKAEAGLAFETGSWDMFFMHLVSSILIILLQTYFINQSSSITNALLSGNVSSDGFTGALTRLAGGYAAKKAIGVVTMPVKALGGLGKGAAAARAAKTNSTMMRLLAGEKIADVVGSHGSGGGSPGAGGLQSGQTP